MLHPLIGEPVFNGKDLNGWSTRAAEKCKFDVTKNGELHVTNGPGQLETKKDFANFVLQLECKVNGDGLNSGVFFRTLCAGRWAGYESQIQNSFVGGDRTKPMDFGTGGIYRRQPARYVVPNDREWFTKTIVADGAHMAVWVNGCQVSDWTDKRLENENVREGKRVGAGAIARTGPRCDDGFFVSKYPRRGAAELVSSLSPLEVGRGEGAAAEHRCNRTTGPRSTVSTPIRFRNDDSRDAIINLCLTSACPSVPHGQGMGGGHGDGENRLRQERLHPLSFR